MYIRHRRALNCASFYLVTIITNLSFCHLEINSWSLSKVLLKLQIFRIFFLTSSRKWFSPLMYCKFQSFLMMTNIEKFFIWSSKTWLGLWCTINHHSFKKMKIYTNPYYDYYFRSIDIKYFAWHVWIIIILHQ
jgi:hypothetical protein